MSMVSVSTRKKKKKPDPVVQAIKAEGKTVGVLCIRESDNGAWECLISVDAEAKNRVSEILYSLAEELGHEGT